MTQIAAKGVPALGFARPPSKFDRLIDLGTRGAAASFAIGIILLLAFIIYMVDWSAIPAFRANGLQSLTHTTWDMNADIPKYGLLAPILGTIYSSCLALLIATVFGVSIAIFLTQNFIPKPLEIILKNIVELLAAIPSVVYGLWGIFVVIPLVRPVCDFLGEHFAWIPLFHGNLEGPGLLPAAIVLAIMVLPTVSAISYDALSAVHPRLKEGAMGLGATKWETILKVTLPTASRGIFGSIILGFGRALGETMALAMLFGNMNEFHISLFSPGNTLAALMANDFNEAQGNPPELNMLLFAGLVLLVITLIVNIIGSGIIQFANRGRKGALQ